MRIATLAGVAAIALVVGLLHPMDRAHAYDRVVDLTFPLPADSGYWYTDNYEADRDGGARPHQAIDLMVGYETPVHAAVGGTIDAITGMGCGWSGHGEKDNPPSYGYAIYIEADDGRRYSYLHLGRDDGPASDAYVDGLTCGSRVERGEHIGYVGDSGNANNPHLHLSVEDRDITDPYDYYDHERLNPYNSLKDAEKRGDFPGFAPPDVSGDAVAISGDWNGDGREAPGWYDRGRVYLRKPDGSAKSFGYGRKGDLPVVGDWNGDGKDTVGIIRDGHWHLRNSNSPGGADIDFRYGRILKGDYPLAGDWDGDGIDTVGIVRGGEWHLRNSNSGGHADLAFTYGRVRSGDIPLTGDWTGDGKDTPAIVRDREWHFRKVNSAGSADIAFKYGRSDDLPVVGDWNLSGVDTPAAVRGSTWMLRNYLSSGPANREMYFAPE